MTVLRICEWPEKVLETKAEQVNTFDANLNKLLKDMDDTQKAAGGIGLAANQVGILKRIFIMTIPWSRSEKEENKEFAEKKWWHDKKFIFINPKITKTQGKTKYQEGCLSFPEIYDYVERHKEVWLTAQDENGKEFEVHADGLFAICIQHEMDHIDGIVFFKRMSRLKANLIKKKMLAKAHRLKENDFAETVQ